MVYSNACILHLSPETGYTEICIKQAIFIGLEESWGTDLHSDHITCIFTLYPYTVYFFAGLRIRKDLFRIRIRIFYFWIPDPDPDPTRVFKLIKIFELKFQSSLSEKFLFKIVKLIFGYHVGDCVTTSKDAKCQKNKKFN